LFDAVDVAQLFNPATPGGSAAPGGAGSSVH
jgi:hypothetical protein